MPGSVGGRVQSKDIPLLIRALFWVCWVRLGLTFSSFETTRRRSLPKTLVSSQTNPDADRLAWAVRRTAQYVPMATCLTRALALQSMLSRKGFSTELILGVSRSKTKEFIAHAWIKKGNDILIGGSDRKIASYSKIASYGPTSA